MPERSLGGRGERQNLRLKITTWERGGSPVDQIFGMVYKRSCSSATEIRTYQAMRLLSLTLCLLVVVADFSATTPSVFAQDPESIGAIDFPEAVDYGMTSTDSYVPSYQVQGPSFLAGSDTWTWKFLPEGYLYHTYLASEAEPRLAVQVFSETHQGSFVDSFIGGRIGFVRFGRQDSPEGFQLDLLGGANLRQDPTPDWDVDSVQFRYDIPLTYRKGPHAWKFGFYHISAHLGDEFLIKNPTYDRLNWLRDSLYLGYSYFPIPEVRLYGEVGWAFNSDVSEPWEFQFGLEIAPVYPTGIHGAPFIAMNVHLHQELDYGGSFNIQGGWSWRGEGLSSGLLRTGPYYFDGGSPQFSFYQVHEQQIGWGLWYDF
ncbi:DUF1207 domain-containing protein [Planctomicrobium sp. SH661]|uniref:DUF1207 domain-containing protein n=1 Tax=Planctomicrobium sp. SH661 TaxID=3448124 RepID=UPI003F5AFDD0